MLDEILFHYGATMVRRLRLATVRLSRGIAIRFTALPVVLHGDVLSIEYRDGGKSQRVEITPGQVDWEETTDAAANGGIERAATTFRPPPGFAYELYDRDSRRM